MTEQNKAMQMALDALCLPCDRWNGVQSQIVQNAIEALRAALAAPQCTHRVVDARNSIVKSGYMCIDCGALFAAADHGAQPAQQVKSCATCKHDSKPGAPQCYACNIPAVNWEQEMTDQDRKYFTAWGDKSGLSIARDDDGDYLSVSTTYAWRGWQAARAQPAKPCPTCESLARTVMLDQTGHDDYYKRMFESAVSSLAKIDQLLGINDDGCGGAEETIDAVRELVGTQPAQEPAHALADKVREALDRQSCPGMFMNIAWEAVVKHYPLQPPRQPLTDEQMHKIDDAHNWCTTAGRMAAYRAIEAAMKDQT